MAKAVLTSQIGSEYDDLREVRYHFPSTYRKQIEQATGDWIVYYEPKRNNGRLVYFATAQISHVVEDTSLPNHFYAYIQNYIDFDYPVPFKVGSNFYERALVKHDGSVNKGAFGRSVRNLPDHEFESILQAGFAPVLQDEMMEYMHSPYKDLILDTEFDLEIQRPIIERVTKRPFREASFAKKVKESYNQTCAITGIRIVNGGNRAEVQAAHIMPVAKNGPDSVRNGLALSSTMHWMFDRGLISIDDDYSILKAKGKIPLQVEHMFNKDCRLILPESQNSWPHPHYLRYHRENIFYG